MAIKKILPSDQPMREIRPVLARYAELFPSCVDCGDLADGLDNRCSKCGSDKEFRDRLAARRQARGRG